MTFNLKVKLLFLLEFCYNFVINRWIAFRLRETNTKDSTLGVVTETDLDLKMTLTMEVKLLKVTKTTISLLLIDIFYLYFNKGTLVSKPTCWILGI